MMKAPMITRSMANLRSRTPFETVRGGAIAAPFLPSDISSLVAWYDMDSAYLLNESDVAPSDTDLIKTIKNRLNPGTYDLSQATSANRPTWNATGATGTPSLSFDGVNDHLISTTLGPAFQGTNIPLTMLIVFRRLTAATSNECPWAFGHSAGGTSNRIIHRNSNTAGRVSLSHEGKTLVADFSSNFQNRNVMSLYTFDGTNGNMYEAGGSTLGTLNQTNTTVFTNFTMGAWLRNVLGDQHTGEIAELLVFDAVPSTADADSVVSYVGDRHGIAYTPLA